MPEGEFGVKETSWQAKRLNLTGELVSAVQLFNHDKPYLPYLQGPGWELYLSINGTNTFDATPKEIDEMSKINNVDNLSQLTIKL